MSRGLLYALVVPLLSAEIWAQVVAGDRQVASLCAVLVLGVIAVRLVLGPQD
jgi:hypothetical protein